MPFCTYCGQSFTRDEHLERHILTHTNVKPYRCPSCHMSFARRDLLQRHYLVHGKDLDRQSGDAHMGLFPKSAGRTPIACANCAKTKTKCDKKFPCSRCASRNLECTVRPARRTTKSKTARQQLEDSALSSQDSKSASDDEENIKLSPLTAPSESCVEQVGISDNGARRSESGLHARAGTTSSSSGSCQSTASPETPQHQNQLHTAASHDSSSAMSLQDCIASWSSMDADIFTAGHGVQFNPDEEGDADNHLMVWPPSCQHYVPYPEVPESSHTLSVDMMTNPSALPGDGCFGPTSANLFNQPLNLFDARLVSINESFPLEQPVNVSAFPHISPGDKEKTPILLSERDATAWNDSWSTFRRDSDRMQHTWSVDAQKHLDNLAQGLRNHGLWSAWSPRCAHAMSPNPEISPLHEITRDKLLAVSQSLLRGALDFHAPSVHGIRSPDLEIASSSRGQFFALPPTWIMEEFMASFAGGFELHYPLTGPGPLKFDEQVLEGADESGSILVLLMMAYGARTAPNSAAQWMTIGLVEACRMPMCQTIPSGGLTLNSTAQLHAALLWTSLAAWSGDRWQTECAFGVRDLHVSAVRHLMLADAFVPRPSIQNAWSAEASWAAWAHQEKRSRLLYGWVMMDQELALFQDRMPSFAVNEMVVPLPDCASLWNCQGADVWACEFDHVYGLCAGYLGVDGMLRPQSLQDLFLVFLNGGVLPRPGLTALQLRLLLQPLQSIASQHQQFRNECDRALPQPQVGEVRMLLERWRGLAQGYMSQHGSQEPLVQASLMLYHLISLQLVSNVGEMERMARGETNAARYPGQQAVITDSDEAWLHAGQVLVLARSFPSPEQQPAWWGGAVYRAGLALWCDTMLHEQRNDHERPMITLRSMLTRDDGEATEMGSGADILRYCQRVLQLGTRGNFNQGIGARLARLAQRSDASASMAG